jgi:hypothetical protein
MDFGENVNDNFITNKENRKKFVKEMTKLRAFLLKKSVIEYSLEFS